MSDASKSLDVLIRTRAELEGANELASSLEKQIIKAKLLRQEYSELETQLASVQGEITKYNEANSETDAIQKELSKSVKTYTKEELEELLKKTGKVTSAKHLLKAAIKGVAAEFPALAHFAKLALNEMTFVIAGISAAMAVFIEKTSNARAEIEQLKLPDINDRQIQRLIDAADGYERLGGAIKKALEVYSSVDAATDRSIAKIRETLDLQKKLLEARKNLELADLGNLKAQNKISGPDYERAKASVEQRYADAGVNADQAARQAELAREYERRFGLRADAQSKLRQAAGIKIGSAAGDDDTDAVAKQRKTDAQARIDESKKRIQEINDMVDGSGGEFKSVLAFAKFLKEFGAVNPQHVIDMERQNIANSKSIIESSDAILLRRPTRDQARKRKADLETAAGKDLGEAAVLDQSLPEKEIDLRRKNAVQDQISSDEAIKRNFDTDTAVREALKKEMEEARQRVNEIIQNASRETAGSVKALGDEVVAALAKVQATAAEATREVRNTNSRGDTNVRN